MSRNDWLIRLAVWTALAGYAAGAAWQLSRRAPRWERWARAAWTLGCAALAAHIAAALGFVHHWSQASVYAETARQTAAVYGTYWGGGMYVNYALLAGWAADATWWWARPASFHRRSRVWTAVWQGFLLFIIFNATVVFVAGPLRWIGLGLCAGLLFLWARPKR